MRMGIRLSAIFFLLAFLHPPALQAQSCDEDEAMIKFYGQSIADLVTQVKKENLADFQNKYHQENCLSKLNLCREAANDVIACFDKAAKDPATPKAQAEADKAKVDAYTKFKNEVVTDHDTLKKLENPKKAKAFVESINFSK